jgi:hypothetical protein
MRSFVICTAYQILLGWSNHGNWGAGHVAGMVYEKNAHRVLVKRPERMGLIGRSSRWWKDNINTDLELRGGTPNEWIHVAQHSNKWHAHLKAVMKHLGSTNADNFLTGWGTVGFSRRALRLLISLRKVIVMNIIRNFFYDNTICLNVDVWCFMVACYNRCGPAERSRYSDLLQTGRSGDRIPMGARFSASVQTAPGFHRASYIMGTGSLSRG